ncbi:recombinase-like helix-turn-helix domain-containing protein [Oceanibacterium hippocampi]|uniref:Recombinase-like domain-containing protein n=1 Tax=Oceanibacterium hippocampi TaxID=745714 RepID=A0A1Y5TGD2_9PROT|nr:recombinase-like helix-turn-helix domain-containing protein [Oceanibacterium hippocampi]SLN63613.1 hypothetical protein OCH7691_02858 [Oceanibacterium hippocampi]
MTNQQYLEVHQTRDRAPTDYENILGDAIERAFAAGVDGLDGLVRSLNEQCVPAPGGAAWTAGLYVAEMKRLGA